jgi:hypothetical protein
MTDYDEATDYFNAPNRGKFAMRGSFAVCVVLMLGPAVRAEEWEPAKAHAVIVGVLEWKSGLTPYPKRHRKDQELRDVLVQRGTPAENIELLLDKDATLPKIRSAIEKTANRAPKGSTLIVYYAGHGWAAGNDYCFANYEVEPAKKDTAWSMTDLGATLAKDFKGQRAFFWADCCFSGGFEVVVDALAKKRIAAFDLTSASTANTSTNNWTFTQSIIDGLRGDPLVDLNGDGKITLGELDAEVREAMKHMEGQKHGFKTTGLDDDFVMAKASGPRPKANGAKFPIGSYVVAGGKQGRVVAVDGETYTVQFYHYSDKVTESFAAKDLAVSTREPGKTVARLDAGMKPDCEVESQGQWWEAKVMKKEKDRWYIHYVGWGKEWDEWVTKERIRFKK